MLSREFLEDCFETLKRIELMKLVGIKRLERAESKAKVKRRASHVPNLIQLISTVARPKHDGKLDVEPNADLNCGLVS